jgi:hypothetical protein
VGPHFIQIGRVLHNPWKQHKARHLGPNVVVECLTSLIRIREIPGSDLGLETRYTDLRFFLVFLTPPDRYRDSSYLKLGNDRLLLNNFRYSLIIPSFDAHRLELLKSRRKIN